MVQTTIIQKITILIVLISLFILTAIILWPIASAIVMGLILSFMFYPLYKKVLSVVKEKNASALIIILLVLLLIFIPIWFLFPIIVRQIFEVYLFIQKIDFLKIIESIFPSLAEISLSKDFALNFNKFITSTAGTIISSASSIIYNLPYMALKAVIMFFVFFFGMRDAEILKEYAKSLSPFSKETEKKLTQNFKEITALIIYGHIVLGILQGVLTGVVFLILGVPNSLVLTVLAIFASIIPILGAWIIWIPVVIYLFAIDNVVSGLIVLIYGSIVISWIDNLIWPYMISKKTKISSAVVLLGMFGGLIVFGILGLIIGPLILIYLLLIIDAYKNKKILSLFSKKK